MKSTKQDKIDNIRTPVSTSRIYRPLEELKYLYSSPSVTSTMVADVSSELPAMGTQRPKERKEYSCTAKRFYLNTVEDTYRMKLQLGQIHDKISRIQLKMRCDNEKYENALARHEYFIVCFERFLFVQYERVSKVLADLEDCEYESKRLKEKLDVLLGRIEEKSSSIRQLENKRRTFEVSERFLSHISTLLFDNHETFTTAATSATDIRRLFSNLNKNGGGSDVFSLSFLPVIPFDSNRYRHVTAVRIVEYLSQLKRQNLKWLSFKLQPRKISIVLQAVNEEMKNDIENRINSVSESVREARCEIRHNNEKIKMLRMRHNGDNVEGAHGKRERKPKLESELGLSLSDDAFIRKLYERCFQPIYEKESSMQIVKYIEEYCYSLLRELYLFEPRILNRILCFFRHVPTIPSLVN
ncbi:hypothetical protein PGB90_009618 [Kerria lacca]